MKCQRCQGMMVKDWIFTDQGEGEMTRCLNCGNAINLMFLDDQGRLYFALPGDSNEASVKCEAIISPVSI